MREIDNLGAKERMRKTIQGSGEKLRSACKRLGFAQAALYTDMIPSTYILAVISTEYGVSIDWLLWGDVK